MLFFSSFKLPNLFFGGSGFPARGSGAIRPTFPRGQAAPGFQSAAQKPKTTPLSLDHPFWSSELIFICVCFVKSSCATHPRCSNTILTTRTRCCNSMLRCLDP